MRIPRGQILDWIADSRPYTSISQHPKVKNPSTLRSAPIAPVPGAGQHRSSEQGQRTREGHPQRPVGLGIYPTPGMSHPSTVVFLPTTAPQVARLATPSTHTIKV